MPVNISNQCQITPIVTLVSSHQYFLGLLHIITQNVNVNRNPSCLGSMCQGHSTPPQKTKKSNRNTSNKMKKERT